MECYFNCKSNKIPDLLVFIGIVFFAAHIPAAANNPLMNIEAHEGISN
jgi:hypothetical protein